jgi:uncharacterized protein
MNLARLKLRRLLRLLHLYGLPGMLMFVSLLSLFNGVQAQTSAPTAAGQAQAKLPTLEILAGIHKISAEVAADNASRSQGLMFRDKLGANAGMLFVFERPSAQCFWMRNTQIPLSIAFIDDDGKVVNIADMKPFDESSHCSAKPVRFALEMDQGWFAKRGIKAGSALSNDKLFAEPKR